MASRPSETDSLPLLSDHIEHSTSMRPHGFIDSIRSRLGGMLTRKHARLQPRRLGVEGLDGRLLMASDLGVEDDIALCSEIDGAEAAQHEGRVMVTGLRFHRTNDVDVRFRSTSDTVRIELERVQTPANGEAYRVIEVDEVFEREGGWDDESLQVQFANYSGPYPMEDSLFVLRLFDGNGNMLDETSFNNRREIGEQAAFEEVAMVESAQHVDASCVDAVMADIGREVVGDTGRVMVEGLRFHRTNDVDLRFRSTSDVVRLELERVQMPENEEEYRVVEVDEVFEREGGWDDESLQVQFANYSGPYPMEDSLFVLRLFDGNGNMLDVTSFDNRMEIGMQPTFEERSLLDWEREEGSDESSFVEMDIASVESAVHAYDSEIDAAMAAFESEEEIIAYIEEKVVVSQEMHEGIVEAVERVEGQLHALEIGLGEESDDARNALVERRDGLLREKEEMETMIQEQTEMMWDAFDTLLSAADREWTDVHGLFESTDQEIAYFESRVAVARGSDDAEQLQFAEEGLREAVRESIPYGRIIATDVQTQQTETNGVTLRLRSKSDAIRITIEKVRGSAQDGDRQTIIDRTFEHDGGWVDESVLMKLSNHVGRFAESARFEVVLHEQGDDGEWKEVDGTGFDSGGNIRKQSPWEEIDAGMTLPEGMRIEPDISVVKIKGFNVLFGADSPMDGSVVKIEGGGLLSNMTLEHAGGQTDNMGVVTFGGHHRGGPGVYQLQLLSKDGNFVMKEIALEWTGSELQVVDEMDLWTQKRVIGMAEEMGPVSMMTIGDTVKNAMMQQAREEVEEMDAVIQFNRAMLVESMDNLRDADLIDFRNRRLYEESIFKVTEQMVWDAFHARYPQYHPDHIAENIQRDHEDNPTWGIARIREMYQRGKSTYFSAGTNKMHYFENGMATVVAAAVRVYVDICNGVDSAAAQHRLRDVIREESTRPYANVFGLGIPSFDDALQEGKRLFDQEVGIIIAAKDREDRNIANRQMREARSWAAHKENREREAAIPRYSGGMTLAAYRSLGGGQENDERLARRVVDGLGRSQDPRVRSWMENTDSGRRVAAAIERNDVEGNGDIAVLTERIVVALGDSRDAASDREVVEIVEGGVLAGIVELDPSVEGIMHGSAPEENLLRSEIIGEVSLPDEDVTMPVRMRVAEFELLESGENRRKTNYSGENGINEVSALNPSNPVWIVVHGRENDENSDAINDLARSLSSQDIQVVTIDWSEAAGDNDTYVHLNGSRWIESVGRWSAEQLEALGFDTQNVNLVGHSWGSFVVNEIAKQMGGVNTIVALDSAADSEYIGGQYPVETVDFAQHSDSSYAFHSSMLGDTGRSLSADYSFLVQAPEGYETNTLIDQARSALARVYGGELLAEIIDEATDELREHGFAVTLFSSLVRNAGTNDNAITSDLFAPSAMANQSPDLLVNSGYEGVFFVDPTFDEWWRTDSYSFYGRDGDGEAIVQLPNNS